MVTFHCFEKRAASRQCAAIMFELRLSTATGLNFDLGVLWTIQEIFQNYTARWCCCSTEKSGVCGMTCKEKFLEKNSRQNKF